MFELKAESHTNVTVLRYSGNLLICTGRHSGARFFRHTTIAFVPVRVSGRDQGRLASMFMELSEPMSLMASALTRPE